MSPWRQHFAAYLSTVLSRVGDVETLATAADIDLALLRRWLSGRGAYGRPDIDMLRRLAVPLDVALIELVVAAGHLTPDEAWPQPPQRRRQPLVVTVPSPPAWMWPCVLLRRMQRRVATVSPTRNERSQPSRL